MAMDWRDNGMQLVWEKDVCCMLHQQRSPHKVKCVHLGVWSSDIDGLFIAAAWSSLWSVLADNLGSTKSSVWIVQSVKAIASQVLLNQSALLSMKESTRQLPYVTEDTFQLTVSDKCTQHYCYCNQQSILNCNSNSQVSNCNFLLQTGHQCPSHIGQLNLAANLKSDKASPVLKAWSITVFSLQDCKCLQCFGVFQHLTHLCNCSLLQNSGLGALNITAMNTMDLFQVLDKANRQS